MPKVDSRALSVSSVDVIGLDEVGMGCIAGPLCVAALGFKRGTKPIDGVNDSKKLSKKKREELLPLIVESASFVGVGWASCGRIDTEGVAAAWQYAARQALALAPKDMHLVVDGQRAVSSWNGEQTVLTKGDGVFWEVASASIVAKVLRDREMTYLADHFPGYFWEKNAGYGTKQHIAAVKEKGPTRYHRTTFIKKIVR